MPEVLSFTAPSGETRDVTFHCDPSQTSNNSLLGGDGVVDTTGHIIWPGTDVLVRFLCSTAGVQLCSGGSVLELGCGVAAVPSIAAASAAAKSIVCSDNNNDVLRTLVDNLQLNGFSVGKQYESRLPGVLSSLTETSTGCLAQVVNINWGKNYLHEHAALHGTVDVLLGSDVVYSEESLPILFETVDALLSRTGVCVLSYVSRWRFVDDALVETALAFGYSVTDVNMGGGPTPTKDQSYLLILERVDNGTGFGARAAAGCAPFLGSSTESTLVTRTSLVSDATLNHVREMDPREIVNEFRVVPGLGGFPASRATQLAESVALLSMLQQLSLDGCQLGDETMATVLPAFANLTHLRELSLADNMLTNRSALVFNKSASASSKLAIEQVDLSRNPGMSCIGVGIFVSQFLGQLKHLAIGGIDMHSDSSRSHLGKLLKKAPNLALIDLSGNDQTSRQLLELFQPFCTPQHQSLKRVFLEGNRLSNIHVLAEVLPERLEALHLQGSEMGDRGCVFLAELLGQGRRFPELVDLNVASNEIGDDGAFAIGEALRTGFSKVNTLRLDRNAIGPRGGKFLVASLRHVRSSQGACIHLASNRLEDGATKGLVEWLENLTPETSVRLVDFGNNGIRGEFVETMLDEIKARGTDAFARGIPHGLLVLNMTRNKLLGDAEAARMFELFGEVLGVQVKVSKKFVSAVGR